jgi:DNA-directed RNA polymerase
MFGKVCYISTSKDTEKVDIMKQVNGIVPNFVHSLDASALMLTTNALLDAGVKDFLMIHDSYGTHCVNIDTLQAETRRAYQTVLNSDLLVYLHSVFKGILGEETVKIPEVIQNAYKLNKTALVEGVLNSTYFFS